MRIATIETKRLNMRSFQKEDAKFAISIWNDREMGEYLPDPSMDEIDPEYIKQIEELGNDKNCCYLISELKTTGERVGTCSFIPDQNGKVYDIAYCVHKTFWKNGYAAEMAEGMIQYARQQGAEKITVRINKNNIASNKIAQNLGFQITGQKSYKKRGTDFIFEDYLYELKI